MWTLRISVRFEELDIHKVYTLYGSFNDCVICSPIKNRLIEQTKLAVQLLGESLSLFLVNM